jgi:4-alpha-glucanotransferase
MTAPRGLHGLARLHGVQTAYSDNDGRRVQASPDALMAALRALGVELPDAAAIPHRLAHRRRVLWERALDPVVVVWTPADGGLGASAPGATRIRTPAAIADWPVRVTIGLEEGGERDSSLDGAALERLRAREVAGTEFVERGLPLPSVPPGYHDLVVEVGAGRARRRYEAVLIAAPDRAVGWEALPGGDGGGRWGVFAPLYALHEREVAPAPGGVPGYPTLGRFADRAADAGASVVGTLPLLAAFLDEPYEPSPYAPVSRLFWNELYVSPEGADGASRAGRFVDPRAAMAERRPALEAEARRFFDRSHSPPELTSFRARNPLADDYARFRALTEALGSWDGWPDRLRARDLRPGDYDEGVARYHLYVQYRAERQLAEVAERGADRGVSLYLDLPMGVHSRGYDVWRERSLFATGASAGAPPDALAAGGQDWGFPPLHPEVSRLQGHRYFVASIRKHLRFAGVLRIDHVMQLHRMFWIPAGDARDGVYVRYPAEELYAVVCLESHRSRAVVVGEDLGTVPRETRRAMRRHGLPGMYVVEFELMEAEGPAGSGPDPRTPDTDHGSSGERPLAPGKVPGGALASIGTHDTPTFAGWWWGEDVRIRRELGQLTEEAAEAELRGRGVMREKLVRGLGLGSEASPDGEREALRVQEALLRRLGDSNAGLVLATLEDLWLEREPQNVPGTTGERNWRRRSSRPLEAMAEGAVAELLRALNETREGRT